MSVHTCNFTKHWMAHHDYKWAFNAPYYPDGNPIEFVFAIAKREYKKAKLQAIAKKQTVASSDQIDVAFKKVKKGQVKKCINRSNYLI